MNPIQGGGPVLLYDGACGLCSGVVRFLLRIDRRRLLRFAALQGPAGQGWLRANALSTGVFDSLVFVRDWDASEPGYLTRTDGLVAALQACGGAGRLLAWMSLIPRPWRDGAYRLVARLRHRLFGPWRARPLPRPEWAERFVTGSPS